MPNWKGKEYPHSAKGVAAYWVARGKDERYKRKNVKAKSAQAKPKPSSVKKKRVFPDDDFAKKRPHESATLGLYLSGMEEEAFKMVDEPESRNLSVPPVKGAPPQPPPPKDKRTSWDKRKGKDPSALWEKAARDRKKPKTTKTGPVTTKTPTSKKPSTLAGFLHGAGKFGVGAKGKPKGKGKGKGKKPSLIEILLHSSRRYGVEDQKGIPETPESRRALSKEIEEKYGESLSKGKR